MGGVRKVSGGPTTGAESRCTIECCSKCEISNCNKLSGYCREK